MKASTERRLFNYLLKFKRGIIIGLLCLMVADAFELAGPFIAKTVIDNHILGVEGIWYKVGEEDNHTATYKGDIYKRADRLSEGESKGDFVTILQVGSSYYYIPEDV